MEEASSTKLEEPAIVERLQSVPMWTREEKVISRRYRFPSFPDAVEFVNHVAAIAERRKHHPFISIDYKMVTLRLTSWHAGGLTTQDFDEAREMDALYNDQTASS